MTVQPSGAVLTLVLCLALAGVFLAIERLLQKPEAELTGLDRMVGYLLLGRFFSGLHAGAQARGYAFSPAVKRGVLILLGVGMLVAAVSLGASPSTAMSEGCA